MKYSINLKNRKKIENGQLSFFTIDEHVLTGMSFVMRSLQTICCTSNASAADINRS